MIKRVVLHGYLRSLVPGGVVEVSAETPKEAIEAMCAMTGEAFAPNVRSGRHMMRIVGHETLESLREYTDKEEIHVVPPYDGGKSKWVQIIIGIVLIATAIINPGGLLVGASALTIGGTTLGSIMVGVGISLVLGGIMQLLAPQPKIDTGLQDDTSKYLGAPGNTVRIGTRRPLVFGTDRVYGHYLSFNIDAKAVSNGANAIGSGSQGGGTGWSGGNMQFYNNITGGSYT